MTGLRTIDSLFTARPTLEGAGVRLRRVFGFGDERRLDPFLLLDDFRSDDPAEFLAGFPWHPHRGIETITYVLAGDVEHGDSLGNSGVISSGDVQWMTAGSGIIHQEMPRGDAQGRMHGFQLWANLPADEKMREPRYCGLSDRDIPSFKTSEGATVRVIAGEVEGVRGPVEGVVIDPEYLDVTVPPGCEFTHPVEPGHTGFAYCIGGEAELALKTAATTTVRDRTGVLFDDGDHVRVRTGHGAARFLLIVGRPLREPIAWRGPVVMNTDEELRTAFSEYADGTFVKLGAPAA